jgi:hypothetical protein
MTTAEEIAEIIKQKLPEMEPGTLAFWGELFGGRLDNLHRLIDCAFEHDRLRLYFDDGEVLSVWSPYDLHIRSIKAWGQPILRIQGAARVRWEWYFYGRPQIDSNRYFQDFVIKNGSIDVTTNIDWYVPYLRPRVNEPAVALFPCF